MPRPKSIPSYRLHRKSGQAVVTLNGRDLYLGKHNTAASRVLYERKIGEWLAAGRQLPVTSGDRDPGLSVVELAAAYHEHAKEYYSSGGKVSKSILRVGLAMKYLNASHGRTLAREFGPLALRSLQATMVTKGKGRVYINIITSEIKRAFRWAASVEHIPASVYQSLSTVPGLRYGRSNAKEKPPIRPVDNATVEATLPFLGRTVADMVRLMLLCGCRPGEICQVRPGDIDRSEAVWCYRPQTFKTQYLGRERRIHLGPKAQEILTPYLLRAADAYCFSPAEAEQRRMKEKRANRKTPVQPSQIDRSLKRPKRKPGDRYVTTSFNRAIRRACDLAFPAPPDLEGVELKAWRQAHCWHVNQLRHSAATQIRQEFGIEAASVTLGHARANTTEIYAEKNHAHSAAIMAKIG